MILPGPMIVIGVPLVVGAILQILRRWTAFMAWGGAIATVSLALWIAAAPLDEPWFMGVIGVDLGQPLVILGRVLLVEPVDQLPLSFIFLTTGAMFVVGWRLLRHSNFFPIGMVMVALLAGTLLVQQVVYAALLVEMAAVLSVFPLHEPVNRADGGGALYVTKGGVRYMTYATLALPGLMITQLLLEQYTLFPNDLGLLNASTALLGISFAILLGAVPFQSWLSTVAHDGAPPVVTFIFTVNLGTVWFMLLTYLQSYSWLGSQAFFGPLFTSLGLFMMVIGGALAASQRRLGRLIGYATLVDNGAMFIALGTQQVTGIALTVMTLLARPLALALMTLGLDGLRRLGEGDDSTEALEGAAWRAPWRAMAFLVGGIAMAGFPLSLGFAARWALYRLVAETNLFQATLALLGSGGVMMGLVGAIRVLLSPLPKSVDKLPVREDLIVVILIMLLIGLTLILGIFPQVPSRLALEMAEEFTFFIP
ncbi:MAG: hypothetical protein JXA33_00425 [Anaerolineae bacterium]|nr:hypothetical protein [Anaerolineae bacterium]